MITGLIAAAIGAAMVGYNYYEQTVVYYTGFENMPWYSWMSGLNCLMGGVVVLCTQTIFAFRLIRVSTTRTPCKLARNAEASRLIDRLATETTASSGKQIYRNCPRWIDPRVIRFPLSVSLPAYFDVGPLCA